MASILAACQVKTLTTSFFIPSYQAQGSIIVLAADGQVNNSLEFTHYKQRFEIALASVGYRIVQNIENSNYVALVSYGIDSGKTSLVSTPIFGSTGGGTTYSSGTVGSTMYSGTSYTMPTYGVVGSHTRSRTQYTRAIAIDIIESKSLQTGNIRKVYEMRTISVGKCGAIVEVFDEMLEGMFRGFPGESGKSKKAIISGDFNC